MDEQRPWHRLFALLWQDFFRDLPVTVEPEKDLSVKKQLLDLLLIRKDAPVLDGPLPDGFEELGTYNLVTFKSFQERLSWWVLLELLAHFVNVRKQVSPSMDEGKLLPVKDFRLYAVCVRSPEGLAAEDVELTGVQPGVYEVKDWPMRVRVVVINELPLKAVNAMLHPVQQPGGPGSVW